GMTGAAGSYAASGGPGTDAPWARDRRPMRRRGEATAADAAGEAWSGARWRIAEGLRFTLAPTSPSAHMAPSAVCTSTRQTTIEEAAPPMGGRFWVSVQRA